MNINTTSMMMVLGIIATIVATVLVYIFILPEKKCKKLNKFGAFLHDVFNFKFLIVEKILQFLYILSTAACICVGFFMLFSFQSYSYSYYSYSHWYGGYGLLVMILGPIAVRLVFECAMLFLILIKNVIQINNKIKSENGSASPFAMPSVKQMFKEETIQAETQAESDQQQ